MTHEVDSGRRSDYELERKHTELERKFIPVDPKVFAHFEHESNPIIQVYINERGEDYSLRLRQEISPEGILYTATIKDRGSVDESGLKRLEVPTPISPEVFNEAFQDAKNPRLFKDRTTPCSGVSIDWIKGYATPIIEIENVDIDPEASDFLARYQDFMIELTGSHKVDNEWIARQLSGATDEEPAPTIAADEILRDITGYRRAGYQKLVIGIAGRSGSGKSTLAREIADKLFVQQRLHAQIMETDWYHRGLTRLIEMQGGPWTNWELPIVYDTAAMAADITRLQQGEAVRKRRFDFASQEPVLEGMVKPADVIIIEGIHAGSADLADVRHMFYEVSTPLATCLGRDVERIMRTDRPNTSIASPEERMRYILEIGEPTYQEIRAKHPRRNVFSASVRPLGGTAWRAQNS